MAGFSLLSWSAAVANRSFSVRVRCSPSAHRLVAHRAGDRHLRAGRNVGRPTSPRIAGSLSFPRAFPRIGRHATMGSCRTRRGSSSCAYRHRPACPSHRLPPRRRPGRARPAGVRRRPVRLRPEAPVTPPDPDSGGRRPAGQPDAFGDWFTTASAPPRRGRPRVRRPRRDWFGWLLSPWLLAAAATVAVATTGVGLWLWQTAPTGAVQARPGAAATITAPAATGGLPGGPGRPLRVAPPLPPVITPVQATARQSQAAGTGSLRLAVRLPPPAVPRRNPGPPRLSPPRPPRLSPPRPPRLSPPRPPRFSPPRHRHLSPPSPPRLSPPRHRRLSPPRHRRP